MENWTQKYATNKHSFKNTPKTQYGASDKHTKLSHMCVNPPKIHCNIKRTKFSKSALTNDNVYINGMSIKHCTYTK